MECKTFQDILSVFLYYFYLYIKLHSINVLLEFPYVATTILIEILLRSFVVITNNKP